MTSAGGALAVKIGHIADILGDLPHGQKKALLARIGYVAVEHLDDLPGTEIRRLADKFGDLAVMQLAPKLKGAGLLALEKMEFMLKYMSEAAQTAAKTRGAAVKALPKLEGKSLSEVRGLLTQSNFVKDAGSTTAQEFRIHRPPAGDGDGSVVRIALTGTLARPWLHLKKEISYNLGYATEDIACKLTDAGVPAAINDIKARGYIKDWYWKLVKEFPVETKGGPLDIMVRIWGDATHLRVTP